MTPCLDRGEYWLLTNAVEYGLPLRVLTLPEWPQDDPYTATIDIVLNKRGHGLDRYELARTLYRLSERGWIALSRDFRRQIPAYPGQSEMQRILDEKGLFDEGVYYKLTARGGEIWESFARPEWDRYISRNDESDEDPTISEVIGFSEKSLKRYMASIAHETPIEAGSEIYDELRSWHATYWRRCPPVSAVAIVVTTRSWRLPMRCLLRTFHHPSGCARDGVRGCSAPVQTDADQRSPPDHCAL